MRASIVFANFFRPKKKTESQTRLARSSACRNWYHLRQEARKTGANPPIWVMTSPPWPVLSLALKLSGKPAITGVWLFALGLLAGGSDDLATAELQESSATTADRGLGGDLLQPLSTPVPGRA